MEHPELETLLEATLPFAQQMLDEHGVFQPFGAALKTDGHVAMVAGGDGNPDTPADELLDVIEATLRYHAVEGNITAGAVCSNVRITPEDQEGTVDAIRVSLEHQDGNAIDVVMPYTLGEDGRAAFGKLGAGPLEPYLFVEE